PEEVQDQMFSEDQTTLLFNVALVDDLDSSQTNETLEAISEEIESIGIGDLQFEITGPAGISADTSNLFKDADLVMLFATVALIFVILILIYRSHILDITPLLLKAIFYSVVVSVIDISIKYVLFVVEI